MRLIVDQSLAAGFILINTRQKRVSLPFKPGVLERKVYNKFGVRALRGYFGPPMRSKNKSCSSKVSLY